MLSAQALAQEPLSDLGGAVDVPDNAQLFLEADTVTYDTDTGIVTAAGGVQIDYGSYKLVAREVVYNQRTRRLVASGDVELQQPDGNRIFADSVDITDDFAEGFISALRIETPDNTRFAAAEATRQDGEVTTFQQGVYTACEPCRENPERAPLWQVKARKIVWNQREKVVRYYGARFELFGAPIAYLPYFQSPDPTVERQSGFLAPEFKQSEELGYGLRVPYFVALSQDKDITVAGTYYSRQGFLGEAEYRQAFGSGFFTLQAAGIVQQDPDAFEDEWPFDPITGDSISPDFVNTERGMIGTTARFALSDRWTFGWDILAQSDQNFSATYDIKNFNDVVHTSEIYLTGLGDRSFFDLRAQKFDFQTVNELDEDVQPLVLPVLDYQRIETAFGGEAELNVNVTRLDRDEAARTVGICSPDFVIEGDGRVVCAPQRTPEGIFRDGTRFSDDFFRNLGLEGEYARASANLEWRDTITTQGGLLITPIASLRGDLYTADMAAEGFVNRPWANNRPVTPEFVSLLPREERADAIADFYTIGDTEIDRSGARGMATAAIEARYPYLIQTANASHVIEPIGQIIVRPDEMDAGLLPNEDAQSLVFNTSNLFELDKFSGYDRIEGGTRANIGLRYAGTLATGYSLDAVVGQSFHLGGDNPFDETDLALIGFDSGLETDRSDYVGSVALSVPAGLTIGAQGRFDEENLDLRRTDVFSTLAYGRLNAGVTYTNIAAQPISGLAADRSQISTTASLKLTDEWTAFGSLGYDIENGALIERSFGIGYADECFSLIASYQNTSDRYQLEESETTFLFRVGLRTISDFDFTYNPASEEDD